MYGAILGDMIGAPYEHRDNGKTRDFPLFVSQSRFTDDTVMTIAVAEALMNARGGTEQEVKQALICSMQSWGRRYPSAGYGGKFYHWLYARHPRPYGSYGNGSAMRVSAAGWLYDSMEETWKAARWTAEVSHNHPEAVKGAEAVASAIWLARNGRSKGEIRAFLVDQFGYDLSRTCDEIRPGYCFDVSCQGTVPEAITAFLEGESFEDVIRTAVSLGGDCDTLTCIAGAIAEAYYGVPEALKAECRARLTPEMLTVLDRWEAVTEEATRRDPFLEGNDRIEAAIACFTAEGSRENLIAVLESIRARMHADGHLLFPVETDEGDPNRFSFRTLQTRDGKVWYAAFTAQAELEKGQPSQVISHFMDAMLKTCMEQEVAGLILNPWGQSFLLTKELIAMLFQADGEEAYTVPDDPITPELLEGGTFLKRATEICLRNPTQWNMVKLMKILRDSWIWIPCNAILSAKDQDALKQMLQQAEQSGGADTLVGRTISNQDEIRMVPDILRKGEEFFFPVFTSAEEMGEYGKGFSKLEKHFLEAVALARNNEKQVTGIVINAFSQPFVVPVELCQAIAELPSGLGDKA